MQDERLRLLALWHGLRRDVDLLLQPLLSHGPVAVSRVASHLDELAAAMEREQAAFRALRQACDDHPQPTGVRVQALPPPSWTRELESDDNVIRLADRRAPH